MVRFRGFSVQFTARKIYAEAERRCSTIIDELDISLPFALETFINQASKALGRPIVPIPLTMPPTGPSGILIQTAARDYILFQRITSRVHQENIILHELAHRFCNHAGIGELDISRSRELFPDLNPEMVLSMLGRTDYSDAQEREAELLASMLGTKMASWSAKSDWEVPPDLMPVVERMERALGSPIRASR